MIAKRCPSKGSTRRVLIAGFGVCGLLVTVGSCGPGDKAPSRDDRAAILAIYENTRAAHFEHDPQKFLAAVGDGYWVVSFGHAVYRKRTDAVAALREYFSNTTFDSVEDVAPPRITIGPRGTTAWLVGQVEVRGHQRGADGAHHPIAFRSAWLDVYQKRHGKWWLEVHANTQRDLAD